jgi:hypothetical protein
MFAEIQHEYRTLYNPLTEYQSQQTIHIYLGPQCASLKERAERCLQAFTALPVSSRPMNLYTGSSAGYHHSFNEETLRSLPSAIARLEQLSLKRSLVDLQTRLASLASGTVVAKPPSFLDWPRRSDLLPGDPTKEKERAEKEIRDDCQTIFESLPPTVQGDIYKQVWILGDKPTEDRFGERNAFNDLARLERAISLSGHFPLVSAPIGIVKHSITDMLLNVMTHSDPAQQKYAQSLLSLFDQERLNQVYRSTSLKPNTVLRQDEARSFITQLRIIVPDSSGFDYGMIYGNDTTFSFIRHHLDAQHEAEMEEERRSYTSSSSSSAPKEEKKRTPTHAESKEPVVST